MEDDLKSKISWKAKLGILAMALTVCLSVFAQPSLALLNLEEAAKANALLDAGRKLLQENKPEEAIAKFRQAREIAKDSPLALVNLGYALERSGHYDEALSTLSEAIKIDSNIPIAWVNLAGVYQCTGQIPKAIETFEEYLKRFPKDAHVARVRALLKLLKETKNTNSADDTVDGKDYFSAATRNTVRKWDQTKFPLKVFIAKGTAADNYQDSFSTQIERAMNTWQTKSNNTVSFVVVDQPTNADIVVRFTSDEKKIAKQGEQGDCQLQLGTSGIKNASITVLTSKTNEALPLGDPLIYWVGLHEFGHAIGLGGHSINSKDIMYATMTFDYYSKDVSERDIATLVRLYQPEVKAGGSPIDLYNEGTKELQKQTVLPADKRNYLPAIEILENCRKLFPDYDLAKTNLSLAYANHAAILNMNGKVDEACGFYKKALSLFDKKTNANDEASIRRFYSNVLKKAHRDDDAAAVLAGKNP
jgi:tetratricopeptide (TPR) repeat protein